MKTIILLAASAVLGMASIARAESDTPPCKFTFATEDDFAAWTVIDANPSATPDVWTYDSSNKAAICNSDKAASDDWLISPAVTLEGGKTYTVAVYAKSSATYDYQTFGITAGNAPETAAQQSIKEIDSYKSTFYSEQTAEFTPASSGTYHLGIHSKASKYNGTLYIQYLSVSPAPEYPAQVSGLTAVAGADGALEARLSWVWPTANSNGGVLQQLSGARIERIDDSSIWSSYQTIATITDNVEMGGTASFTDTTLPKAGPYTYRVTAFNADGDANNGTKPTASVAWVGEDTPNPVTGLTAAASGDNVLIGFTKPTEGINGAYIDISNISYKIVRKTGTASTVLEDFYKGELPYTDSSITAIGSYTYAVTAVSKSGNASKETESNTVVAGPALTIPYESDLTKSTETALFAISNANGDSYTWKFSSGLDYWGGSEADDWAFSPRIKLEAGKAYQITVSAKLKAFSGIKEADYKNLAVAIGRGATPESMAAPISEKTFTSSYVEDWELPANVTETGEYNIGIHVFGQSNSNDIVVTKLSVKEISISPLAPENVTAERAAGGVMAATVFWKNPVADNTGNPLTAIDRCEIFRNGSTLVETRTSRIPGAEESFTDTSVPEAGTQTYTVRCYLGANSSEASATTEWVGLDAPSAVTGLQAEADGMLVTLTFDAPSGTVHDGYLEQEGMGYLIQRNGLTIEDCYLGSLPYTDNVETLAAYTYSVAAVTASGLTGEAALSNKVVAGDAMEIPYEADFSTGDDFSLMSTFDGNGDGRCWSYSSYDDAAQIYSKKSEEGDWLFTPSLKISNTLHYKVTVSASLARAWSESSYTTVNVSVVRNASPDKQVVQLGSFLVDGALTENHGFDFELGESGKYNIGIQAMGNDDSQTLFVSGISVESDGVSGIRTPGSDGIIRYDSDSGTIRCPAYGRLAIIDSAGIKVADCRPENGGLNVGSLAKGIYIAAFTGNDGQTVCIKFIK